MTFSPHTWGCTYRRDHKRQPRYVFPTHVGVYLTVDGDFRELKGFPHTRGGVPRMALDRHCQPSVFPTHVGVYLVKTPLKHLSCSFPHTRGGVPWYANFLEEWREFSPHTWGCTADMAHAPADNTVFPTHVGVYLANTGECLRRYRFPHTRGGVPVTPTIAADLSEVFPTHVGVYLRMRIFNLYAMSFPHTRGSVPSQKRSSTALFVFSPHTWGCTANTLQTRKRKTGFPHTRGGVPSQTAFGVPPLQFSPHTWGCTAEINGWLSPSIVFPTHVGVYLYPT